MNRCKVCAADCFLEFSTFWCLFVGRGLCFVVDFLRPLTSEMSVLHTGVFLPREVGSLEPAGSFWFISLLAAFPAHASL